MAIVDSIAIGTTKASKAEGTKLKATAPPPNMPAITALMMKSGASLVAKNNVASAAPHKIAVMLQNRVTFSTAEVPTLSGTGRDLNLYTPYALYVTRARTGVIKLMARK